MDKKASDGRVPLLKRGLIVTLTGVLGFLLVFVVFLLVFQRRMIYFPQRYEASYRLGLPRGTAELEFSTTEGKQVAFYIPLSGDGETTPDRLWVLFHGNAARGLDWLDFLETIEDANAGFFLVDYPGYGKSQGSPSRKTIRETSEAALQELSIHLSCRVDDLESRLNVLAFSIGTGAGLEFAAAHPVRRVILLAPFTDLIAMARRSVGWPLCYLLIDRYDNRARLQELANRDAPPEVHIFHGTADAIIPFRMGRTLAEEFPTMIQFHSVPNVDHNFLLEAADEALAPLMTRDPDDPTS